MKKTDNGIEVIATEKGYYGEKIREVGDVFAIESADDLGQWMEPVNGDRETIEAARSAGNTKVIARNGENVVTEGSPKSVKAAALKHMDPGAEGRGKAAKNGDVM